MTWLDDSRRAAELEDQRQRDEQREPPVTGVRQLEDGSTVVTYFGGAQRFVPNDGAPVTRDTQSAPAPRPRAVVLDVPPIARRSPLSTPRRRR